WCGLVVCGCVAAAWGGDWPAASEPASSALPDAADLVREVREGEQWIHRVKSLQVTFEEVARRSEVGIAAMTATMKRAGSIPDPKNIAQLRPALKIAVSLFFDGKHFRYESKAEDDLFRREELWDGAAAYDYYYSNRRSPYLSINSKAQFGTFEWLMADAHQFEWTDLNTLQAARPAKDFVAVGREKFRGVDCWKLMTINNQDDWPERWFVGVSDNRLYGVWEGAAGDPAEMLAMNREFAAADGFEIKTEDDAETWLDNLSQARKDEVREKSLVWVGRYGLPAWELWFSDYLELQPGIWFPKRHGSQVYSTLKEDGTSGGPVHPDHMTELTATDVRLDEPIADSVFAVSALGIREGAEVWDGTHFPTLEYRYKAKFTPEEWQAILDAAEKREAAYAQAVAAQQRAQAMQQAAQRAMQNQPGPGGEP
ncbi:MAG TPA: hypothetical protein VM008_05570, partial [Phycisphaerae bacterium]|nr:hypothetical protein [Phycisphaerae bacterium]